MNLKPKLPTIILLIAALSLAYWSFPIVKNRYFSPAAEKQEEKTTEQNAPNENAEEQNSTDTTEDEPNIEQETADEEDTAVENSSTETDLQDNSFLEILPSDCQNNCEDFGQTEDIQYCRQYCGLIKPKKDLEGCDKFQDLEKDYCLKDEAIQKKDGKLCDQIEDNGIQKSCRNRITEDLLETQQ